MGGRLKDKLQVLADGQEPADRTTIEPQVNEMNPNSLLVSFSQIQLRWNNRSLSAGRGVHLPRVRWFQPQEQPMPFPTTVFGIATVILLLVPGLVYAIARRHLKGFQYDDLSKDARIAQALVISLFLDTCYLLVASQWLGDWVEFKGDQAIIKAPSWLMALAVLVGGFIVPCFIAIVLNIPYRIVHLLKTDSLEIENGEDARDDESPRTRKLSLLARDARNRLAKNLPFRIERTAYYQSVPNAWDWGAREPRHRWVRVTLPDGRRIGGFFGPGSYVSTYPEPRDIFISHQYHLKEDGSWGSMVEGTAGLWLKIGDDHIVEFLDPQTETGDEP